MKLFTLVIKDIYKFFCGRKSIFLLIVIGLIFNTIGISFYYGYYMKLYKKRVSYNNKTYSYDFINDKSMNEDGNCPIYELLFYDSHFPKITSAVVTEDSIKKEKLSKDNSHVVPIGEYSISKISVLTGRYFNNTEINEGINVTIPTTDALMIQSNPLSNGDLLNIKGKNYKIVGQTIYSEIQYGSFIPIKTYINNNIPIKYMHVEFESKLMDSQKNYLSSKLKKFYPDIQIKFPPIKDYESLDFFWSFFSQVLALFSIAVINIFCLIYYWVSTNTRKYCIFLICGCYKFKVFLLILTETFIMFFSTFIVGNLIINLFQNKLIEFDIVTTLNVQDYLKLLGISIIPTLLMGIYTGIRICYKLDIKKV